MLDVYVFGAGAMFSFMLYVVKKSIDPSDRVVDRVFEGTMGILVGMVCAVFWPLVITALVLLWIVGIVRREDIRKYKEEGKYDDW